MKKNPSNTKWKFVEASITVLIVVMKRGEILHAMSLIVTQWVTSCLRWNYE